MAPLRCWKSYRRRCFGAKSARLSFQSEGMEAEEPRRPDKRSNFCCFLFFEGNTDELSSFDERDLLGKGSFGTVFKKKKDDEWFAIKQIGSAMGPLEGRNELLYGAVLKRDELVPLKSAFTRTVVNARGESTFCSYLMFPFADHGDLLTFLNKKADLSIADKAMLAVQLCKALSDLHALGKIGRA